MVSVYNNGYRRTNGRSWFLEGFIDWSDWTMCRSIIYNRHFTVDYYNILQTLIRPEWFQRFLINVSGESGRFEFSLVPTNHKRSSRLISISYILDTIYTLHVHGSAIGEYSAQKCLRGTLHVTKIDQPFTYTFDLPLTFYPRIYVYECR